MAALLTLAQPINSGLPQKDVESACVWVNVLSMQYPRDRKLLSPLITALFPSFDVDVRPWTCVLLLRLA